MKRLTVNTFALQSLKKRKKQYAALIAGIILAMVFSSGTLFFVSCMFSSQKELRRRDFGTADYIVFSMAEEAVPLMEADNPGVRYGLAHMLGFVYTEEEEDGAAIGRLDEQATEYYQPVILEGRWPENAGEIAAERDALLRMELSDAKPGDTLTLNLLVQDGPTQRAETSVVKQYTLVGILGDKRKNLELSSGDAKNNLPAIFTSNRETVEPGGKEALTAYITLSQKTLPEARRITTIGFMRVDESFAWDLIDNLRTQTIFSAVLSGVLMFASAIGIVNAFSSDLHERKRQIGLLRAVGATKRQIIGVYGRETLFLSLICAPVSLCISYFGVKIITGFMDRFVFIPSWGVLLGSVGASLVFVLLASLIPLAAAARVSPMQAIRNTELGRKMKRMRIRSKKQFDVSRLLAGRNLRFYRQRTALTALILATTVFLSSYAFSFLLDQSSGGVPEYSDYYIALSHDQGYEPYMNWTVRTGYTENDKQTLLNCSGVKSVEGTAEINTLALFGETDDYLRIANYNWWYMNLEPSDWQNLTPQNYREKLSNVVSPGFQSFLSRLELSGRLIPMPVASHEESDLGELSGCVLEGKINVEKLSKSGEEIILIAPDELGVTMISQGEYGWSLGVAPTDQLNSVDGALETAERTVHAGDTVTLTTVTSQPTPDGSLSTDFARTDRTVRIGAVCYKKGLHFRAASWFGFATTTEGLRKLTDSFKYQDLTVTMADEVTEETNERMSAVIERIASGVPAYVYSAYEQAQKERTDKRQAMIAVLAIVILMLSIAGSMINNALTTRIREDKREIGTLRAVGANATDLTRSYVRELLFMTGFGSAVGFAAFLTFWFGVGMIDWLQWHHTSKPVFEPLHIWQTALGVLALFGVCALNLHLQVRKHMKNSIVENIREL